ncbi:MAG: SpoIIE family protein phosphatase [Endozoicomonas sp. (ex Botrylloides leachii)]|nr:SpoIIE family protein phosphatase [Endozoicomonas sp. (ex Botrylloides leachii)]
MKLLIVEDARDQRLLLSTVLKKKGYQVVEAENGIQALDILKEQSGIHMVVSDWLMPEMDGVQLCQAIRQPSFDHYLYFILLTSKTEHDSLVEGINAGADDFVSKPVDFNELEARLKAGFRIIDLKRVLEEKNQALSKAITTIEQDLDSAARTLAGLLAPAATVNNVVFDWFFRPCKQLGGDMLGYQPLDDDHVFFYQLDVAGHGVPSALLSFTLNHVLSEPATGVVCKDDPALGLAQLNNRFQTKAEQMLYFTIVCGTINNQTGDIVMAQAGHPCPLWIKKETGAIDVIQGRGVPIGMLPDATYQTIRFKLNSGDRLFLYSDGLIECANEQGELFGEDRLCQVLERTFCFSVKETIDHVETEINHWGQRDAFEDDITYLVLEWNQ